MAYQTHEAAVRLRLDVQRLVQVAAPRRVDGDQRQVAPVLALRRPRRRRASRLRPRRPAPPAESRSARPAPRAPRPAPAPPPADRPSGCRSCLLMEGSPRRSPHGWEARGGPGTNEFAAGKSRSPPARTTSSVHGEAPPRQAASLHDPVRRHGHQAGAGAAGSATRLRAMCERQDPGHSRGAAGALIGRPRSRLTGCGGSSAGRCRARATAWRTGAPAYGHAASSRASCGSRHASWRRSRPGCPSERTRRSPSPG